MCCQSGLRCLCWVAEIWCGRPCERIRRIMYESVSNCKKRKCSKIALTITMPRGWEYFRKKHVVWAFLAQLNLHRMVRCPSYRSEIQMGQSDHDQMTPPPASSAPLDSELRSTRKRK